MGQAETSSGITPTNTFEVGNEFQSLMTEISLFKEPELDVEVDIATS